MNARTIRPLSTRRNAAIFLSLGTVVSLPAGCFSISIAPSCPRELGVGESGTVWANELNPGAIPTYQWEVIPADAGTFQDPAKAMTQFTAQKAGDAVIRLTAADGLWQVVSQCTTKVVSTGTVSVQLAVDPSPITIGQEATLTCISTGELTATTLALTQTAGPDVSLMPVSLGTATFTPEQTGQLTFECVGTTAAGQPSAPAVANVTVREEGGRGGGR